jgi:hypothetical protein
VPGSNIQSRPDFRCDALKLIIEFDGYRHYNDIKTIINDHNKSYVYGNMGYKIIRIPYFIQLSTIMIKQLFGVDYEYIQSYQHGFIDEAALLPANFNEEGVKRFIKDLDTYKFAHSEIIMSLKNKIRICNNIDMVLPPSLHYLAR